MYKQTVYVNAIHPCEGKNNTLVCSSGPNGSKSQAPKSQNSTWRGNGTASMQQRGWKRQLNKINGHPPPRPSCIPANSICMKHRSSWAHAECGGSWQSMPLALKQEMDLPCNSMVSSSAFVDTWNSLWKRGHGLKWDTGQDEAGEGGVGEVGWLSSSI